MKRVLTSLAIVLAAISAAAGCNDYGNTFQANTGAQITTLSPSNIAAGSSSFTLTVNGSGFVTQTYIMWNGGKLATSDITDTAGDVLQVYATVPASLVLKAGKAEIQTQNPFSGAGNNGLSNPINFIINSPVQPNPVPLLQLISPNNANANAATLQLTLTGADFLTGAAASSVFWNATYPTAPPSTLPSTCTAQPSPPAAANTVQCPLSIVSATTAQIQVTVPAALLTVPVATCGQGQTQQAPPVASVNVVNPANQSGTPPAGGGGSSNAIAFVINPVAACPAAVAAAQSVEETPTLSADGRYVAYTARDGTHTQIYLRDTCEGAPAGCAAQTSLVSVATDGLAANDDSHTPSMSADGRYVAFASAATDLLSGAAPSGVAGRQIYLRDTCTGAPAGCVPATQLVSTDPAGQLIGTEGILPSVSASGRFVAFVAVAKSKAPASSSTAVQPNSAVNSGFQQIFVRDTCLGAANCTAKTSRISLQPGDGSGSSPAAGIPPPGPAVSGDAKKIALNGGGTAVLFTQSVAVDDRVFVAVLQGKR